jgi:cytochrome c oxidase subunit IV
MSDAPAAAEAAHDDHHDVNYMAKFWWLVGLTIAEVVAAIVVPLPFKLVALAAFAFWKAGIVLQYFMHLKTEGIALKMVVMFPLSLIIVLFTLFLTDAHFMGYSGL